MAAPTDHTLQAYARRLANLSGQNKALLFLRPSTQQDIDLLNLDFAAGSPALSILEQLVAGKSRIPLCALGMGGASESALFQRLKNINRKAAQMAEEVGTQDLHLGWPLATGRWTNDGLVRAPLLLFPVKLWSQGGTWYLAPQENEGLAFNKAFLLGLAHFNGLSLAPELIEEDFEGAPKDFLAFRTWLYEKLKAAQLPIHFNQDLFFAPLQPLRAFTRDELAAETTTGAIKLMPEAVLGLFPQADSYMGADYDYLESTNLPLSLLIPKQASRYTTPHPAWPLAVDGSQEAVLDRLRAGESLCVQGPPGTGKSQLIANAAADALSAGRKVLIVCQKRAALEVVHRRLAEAGLGDWLAHVHDFRADRATLFDQLSGQLLALTEWPQRSAQLKQQLDDEATNVQARQLADTDAELEAFRAALFEPGPSGRSAKSLYMAREPQAPTVSLGGVYLHFTYPKAEVLTNKLAQLDSYRQSLGGLHRFWTQRRTFYQATNQDRQAHLHLLESWPAYKRDLEDVAAKSNLEPKEARQWLVRLSRPAFITGLERATRAAGDAQVASWARTFVVGAKPGFIQRLSTKSRAFYKEKPYLKAITKAQLENGLSQMVRPEVDALLRALEEAQRAHTAGPLFWLKYRLFGANSQAAILCLYGEGNRTERFARTIEGLQAWLQIRAFRQAAVSKLPALGFLLPEDPADVAGWQRGMEVITQALAVARFFTKAKLTKSVHKIFFSDAHTRKAYIGRVKAVAEELAEWTQDARERWSPAQIQLILKGGANTVAIAESLISHFDVLAECDRISHNLDDNERAVLQRMLQAKQPLAASGGLSPLFTQSLLASWIDHTEQASPALRLAAGPLLDHRRRVVARALHARQQGALVQILQRLYQEAEALGPGSRPLKELAHQVRKKRQLWSLRRVLERYAEPSLRLLPCWLASPETVSAIMPKEAGLFDLVIFDEASQCFAERGLPAAWRGKQILVAGDSKQLQPFDLYRVRYDGAEDDDSADTEAISWLDLAHLHLPEATLQCHYRSTRHELIAFSNRHFYQGRLQALPRPEALAQQTPAIQVVPVPEGRWHLRQNEPEARALVEAALKQLAQHPDNTLGIVTFNQPQQVLIQDLLEEAAQSRNFVLPASLFVKNIENVQGDERDFIFFSLGYGPDEEGKIRLQFGSLSLAGGENRLNVAITRARLGIRLFTSLSAALLSRAATAAPGAKLLAAYLAYAEQVSEGQAAYQVMAQPSPAAGSLAAHLAKTNSHMAPLLDYADLTYVQDGNPAALVFTDDVALQAAPSARDYLIVRPAFATGLGWPIEQYWSRNKK